MGNTFGKIFRLTTWGESHGLALGCVIDGCPPGLVISKEEIQKDLDRRKPGQSETTTQRKEEDKIKIGSGFAAAVMKGSQHNDQFYVNKIGKIRTKTNFSGGI